MSERNGDNLAAGKEMDENSYLSAVPVLDLDLEEVVELSEANVKAYLTKLFTDLMASPSADELFKRGAIYLEDLMSDRVPELVDQIFSDLFIMRGEAFSSKHEPNLNIRDMEDIEIFLRCYFQYFEESAREYLSRFLEGIEGAVETSDVLEGVEGVLEPGNVLETLSDELKNVIVEAVFDLMNALDIAEVDLIDLYKSGGVSLPEVYEVLHWRMFSSRSEEGESVQEGGLAVEIDIEEEAEPVEEEAEPVEEEAEPVEEEAEPVVEEAEPTSSIGWGDFSLENEEGESEDDGQGDLSDSSDLFARAAALGSRAGTSPDTAVKHRYDPSSMGRPPSRAPKLPRRRSQIAQGVDGSSFDTENHAQLAAQLRLDGHKVAGGEEVLSAETTERPAVSGFDDGPTRERDANTPELVALRNGASEVVVDVTAANRAPVVNSSDAGPEALSDSVAAAIAAKTGQWAPEAMGLLAQYSVNMDEPELLSDSESESAVINTTELQSVGLSVKADPVPGRKEIDIDMEKLRQKVIAIGLLSVEGDRRDESSATSGANGVNRIKREMYSGSREKRPKKRTARRQDR